jgi:hypothetical protein
MKMFARIKVASVLNKAKKLIQETKDTIDLLKNAKDYRNAALMAAHECYALGKQKDGKNHSAYRYLAMMIMNRLKDIPKEELAWIKSHSSKEFIDEIDSITRKLRRSG